MIPSSSLAGLILLSLVPGFIFLRASENSRKPRPQSSLIELLEVVAVGVGTTGVAALAFGFYDATALLHIVHQPRNGDDLRQLAGFAIATLGLATGLALLLAFCLQTSTRDRYTVSPWEATFARKFVPAGHMPHVSIELLDGSSVDGVLHSYSMSSKSTHRDMVLKAPIGITWQGHRSGAAAHFLSVPAEQARTISLLYAPDPEADKTTAGDSPAVKTASVTFPLGHTRQVSLTATVQGRPSISSAEPERTELPVNSSED